VQGFINSTVPVLQSEVSPARARGRFVCFQLSLLNLGIFIAYWVGYGFTPMTGSKAWRIPVALQAIFIIPMLVLVFIVPESPRWLASHGRAEESLAVIARIQNKPATHHDVLTQHKEIQDAVELERSIGSGTWKDLLKEDRICSRRRLLIACSIQFFQQVGGINAIIFYAGNFFSLVSDKAALLAGGLFTWFFIASFIPWFLIDTAGRRKLLLACVTGMALAFATESALVWKVQTSASKAAAGAAIAVLFVYMGMFTVSEWCRHVLTLDRLPGGRLGVSVGDPAPSTATKGLGDLDRLQLDHQLHDCPGCPDRSQASRVQVLHCEWRSRVSDEFPTYGRSSQSSTPPSCPQFTCSTRRPRDSRSRRSTYCSARRRERRPWTRSRRIPSTGRAVKWRRPTSWTKARCKWQLERDSFRLAKEDRMVVPQGEYATIEWFALSISNVFVRQSVLDWCSARLVSSIR